MPPKRPDKILRKETIFFEINKRSIDCNVINFYSKMKKKRGKRDMALQKDTENSIDQTDCFADKGYRD